MVHPDVVVQIDYDTEAHADKWKIMISVGRESERHSHIVTNHAGNTYDMVQSLHNVTHVCHSRTFCIVTRVFPQQESMPQSQWIRAVAGKDHELLYCF